MSGTKSQHRLVTTFRITVVFAATVTPSHLATACPFCSAVSQTFAEEIEAMEVVALAAMKGDPPQLPDPGSDLEDLPTAKFELTQFIKGAELAEMGQEIDITYFGPVENIDHYLIMGADPPDLMWASPLGLTEAARQYILKLSGLEKNSTRLRFFQKFLEHPDEMLARDAYDEFARAPYEDVIALKPDMDRGQLVDWVKNLDIPVGRRKLYVTMLGVCGTDEDAQMLEEMMRSGDKEQKGGLDALIACYLTLRGAPGLPVIEELYLNNLDAEYSDTYSAVMALRFHGNETEALPQADILRALRWVLDRPDLADLVIPDLARWQDWTVIDRLVKLYEDADEEANWVRVPIVNYMRACKLPEGAAAMKRLEEIDPGAVKRASMFFPFDQFAEKDVLPENGDENNLETTQNSSASIDSDSESVGESNKQSKTGLTSDQMDSPNSPQDEALADQTDTPHGKQILVQNNSRWIPRILFGLMLLGLLAWGFLLAARDKTKKCHE